MAVVHPDHHGSRALRSLGRGATVVGLAVVLVALAAVLAYVLWVLGIIVVKAVSTLPLGGPV